MSASIQDIREKLKGLIMNDLYFYTILIIVISVLSFGLGRWSMRDPSLMQPASKIVLTQQPANVVSTQASSSLQLPSAADGTYVASKKGTKYHLRTCPGANRISDKNKIYFASEQEAQAAGYTRAKNCTF